MRVHVENFQSLADVVLTVEGLTVLVGPSNVGKSALIRALSAVLFNRSGSYFVRDGETNATVAVTAAPTIETARTVDAEWKKGASPAVYTVDGERYQKVGKTTPDVLQAAGYRDLEVGEVTLRPQVHAQSDPRGLFLVHDSGATLVDTLAQASKLDVYARAGDACGDDARKATADAKRVAARVAALQDAVDACAPLAREWLTSSRALVSRHAALGAARERWAQAQRHWQAYVRAGAVPPPQAVPLLPRTFFPEAVRALRVLRLARAVPAAASLPPCPDASRWAAVRRGVLARSVRVSSPCAVADLPGQTFAAKFDAARRRRRVLHLPTPCAVPSLPVISTVDVHRRWTATEAVRWNRYAAAQAQAQVTAADQDLTGCTAALAEFVRVHPVCPTCGQVTGVA